LVEFKEGENCNRRNTFEYFEDYNFRLTQKSGKLAICGWALPMKVVLSPFLTEKHFGGVIILPERELREELGCDT